MGSLLEYVGCVHIFLGPYRGNPIAIYLKRTESGCLISPKVYPWNDVVGVGDTPNKAAADFEEKWKAQGLTPDMYSGPSWEGGIKPERSAPPKPAPPPKPAAPAAGSAPAGQPSASSAAAQSDRADRAVGAPVSGNHSSHATPAASQLELTAAASSANVQSSPATHTDVPNSQPSGRTG